MLRAVAVLGLIGCVLASDARAEVVIIANRTTTPVRFDALSAGSEDSASSDARWRRYTIDAGDLISIPLGGAGRLNVRGRGFGDYELQPYGMYYVGTSSAGKLELNEIGLRRRGPRDRQAARGLIAAQTDIAPPSDPPSEKERSQRRTITVSVYVDEDERAAQNVWQRRLQDRVAAASAILERTCGIKLAVKSFGVWQSDNAINEFELSLREFEQNVRPRDAQIAIGFTSQYEVVRGRTHMGGTRGPLHTHIILREWSQHVSEAERLELLVHELGHYLGAVHSPESNSVMRPVLGDRKARAKAFRIALDPLNALAMNVVGEEIGNRGITSFSQLSMPSRERLEMIYSTIAEAMPNDPAAPSYLEFLGRQRQRP